MKNTCAVLCIVITLVAFGRHGFMHAAQPDEISLKDLPEVRITNDYRVEPYIRAAAKLQQVGMEKAVEILRNEARTPEQDMSKSVILLCRMLFSAKLGGEFRRPWLGAPFFIGDRGAEPWKLEPIEVVDGVPFLIVNGYLLAGHPESSEDYLEYCVKNCEWSKSEFKPMGDSQKLAALEKLLASTQWKQPLPVEAREFLSRQLSKAD